MAEAKQQEKIPGLTEEWLLVDKDEVDDHGNIFEQGTEQIVAQKINQTLVAEDNASAPKPEAELAEVEEKQEVKENSDVPKENDVIPEQKDEPSEVEEKREPVENASAAEENSADPIPEKEQAHEVEEKEEDVEETATIKLETAPADFRFPTTNQTRHCFTRYIEYHRCINAKGEGAPECQKFAKYYRSLCPGEWVERWNEQRENGTFPGPL